MSIYSKEQFSPITGIIGEELVFLDFGVYLGKSVMEIFDVDQDFYQYMKERRDSGELLIKRMKDKSYLLTLDRF